MDSYNIGLEYTGVKFCIHILIKAAMHWELSGQNNPQLSEVEIDSLKMIFKMYQSQECVLLRAGTKQKD